VSLVLKNQGSTDFTPVPAGTHLAICVLVVDMGVQPGNGIYKPRHQLFLSWELPNELLSWKDKNGRQQSGPMRIGRTYTMSLAPKANLRADLESWRGKLFTDEELKSFDVSAILGAPCLLGVVHKESTGKTRAAVSCVMRVATGTQVPAPKSPLIAYDVDQDDPESFAALPPWLQEKIKNRMEPAAAEASTETVGASEAAADQDFNDAIPF
jgi:hypothetical protein